MKCPKCEKIMHSVCSNKTCQCYDKIPVGELPMTKHWMAFGVIIPMWLGNFLWKATWFCHIGDKFEKLYKRITGKYLHWDQKFLWKIRNFGIHPASYLHELEGCPYCGFKDLFESWEERSMEDVG